MMARQLRSFAKVACMIAAMVTAPAAPVIAAPVSTPTGAVVAKVQNKVKQQKVKNQTVKEKSKINSFTNPDFAFPETVSKNAATEYASAMKKGDGLNALKAAIQISIADNSRDHDLSQQSLARFAEIANNMKAPWRQLAMLLEAQLYADIYEDDSYLYDSRRIPLTPAPENVDEWSRPIFALKIDSLISGAQNDAALLAGIPLKDISGLLRDSDDAVKAGMSVLDFICLKSFDIINDLNISDNPPLRFGEATEAETPEDRCRNLRQQILDNSIARALSAGNKNIASRFAWIKYSNISYEPEREAYLKKCLEEYGNTEWGANFLCAECQRVFRESKSENVVLRQILQLLKDFAEKYPSAEGIGQVNNMIATLTAQCVETSVDSQVLPDKEWKCRLKGVNVYNFTLLLFRVPESVTKQQVKLSQVGEPVHEIPVHMAGSTPDVMLDTITMPALAPGRYVIFASRNRAKTGVIGNNDSRSEETATAFTVSALSTFDVVLPGSDGRRIYVVKGSDMAPVAGARVTWKESVYRGPAVTKVFTTDSRGSVVVPRKSASVIIEKGNDRITTDYYGYDTDSDVKRGVSYNATILTDLSIYRPGQQLGYVAVIWKEKDHELKYAAAEHVKVELRNANYEVVDTLSGVTDRFGRISGKFTIPDNGLLGQYSLTVSTDDDMLSECEVQVADYKSPTFRVVTGRMNAVGKDSVADDPFKIGDILSIDGVATTYSGMPVAGAAVNYTIRYMPWRIWYHANDNSAACSGETVTGADGTFHIELPTETLRDTPYAGGRFLLNVSVTNAAGETETAQATSFSFGTAYSINLTLPDIICADDPTSNLSAAVSDMAGKPARRTLYYVIADKNGKSVASGSFESPEFRPDFSVLPSGSYKITFSFFKNMKGDESCPNAEKDVIIYRTGDKRPPVETALWVPQTTISMKAGDKRVSIPVGNSYDGWIWAAYDNGEKSLGTEWLRVNDGIIHIMRPMPSANEKLFVTFAGMHDLKGERKSVTVIPAAMQKRVEIATETFRDKIDPGVREEWNFRFSVDGVPMSDAPVMAVMSNKALNALAPFSWHLNPYSSLRWLSVTTMRMRSIRNVENMFTCYSHPETKNEKSFAMPIWNFYGRSLYGGYHGYGYMMMDMAMPTASAGAEGRNVMASKSKQMRSVSIRGTAVGNTTSESESADEDSEVAEEAVEAPSGENEPLREVECPLAFFMPDMMTDAGGNAVVGFDVPQFNGTWQFQIAGYDPEMRGEVKMLDAVASKKVMVQMNAPRFLRTGDKASVSATLYNNSDTTLPVSGLIEVLDGEKVVASLDAVAQDIPASGQRTVTLSIDVPANVSQLLIRAYAAGGAHRDGEQSVTPVLPSSTPVLESKTFYAGPGTLQISVELPANHDDASVTLQYCGNPIWECVTALPEITNPSSSNILAQVNALYGMSIAGGLVKRYPRVAEALRTFASPGNAADSTLVSNLSKNASLKIVELGNTPWVNDAADETRRMSGLVKYTDSAEAEKSINAIIENLRKLQNNNGGWSWCDNMPSSEYITGRVLLHFAMLKGMGYLPDEAEDMATKAFRYVDGEMMEEWIKSDRKYFSTSELLNYLYVKSFFPKVKDAGNFGELRKIAMKRIAEDWKQFDIYNKATAVTLEWRAGNRVLARTILESLRQFASVSPDKGMWFANLEGVWSGWNPLITTAQVLEAYGEVSPKDAAVDALRQWLLLSKQTQNWGEMQATSEIVHAILSTGHDWTVASEPAVVTVGGKEVQLPARTRLIDSFTLTLTPEQISRGDIKIEKRSAGPAWGGVVSQYVLPIADVKAAGVPQLGISKDVYVMSSDNGVATPATDGLKVGDKVRVTLTIKCDRDLEYVAVTDARSSCLEPVGQLSGYTASDGVWFYREVRDEATNLFIPYLPKGTHVISYECYVDRAGEYTAGIASAQSQYAPVIAAHSEGVALNVK